MSGSRVWRVVVVVALTLGLLTSPSAWPAGAAGSAPGCQPHSFTRDAARQLLRVAEARATQTAEAEPVGSFPEFTDQAGTWQTTTSQGWTSGFFPGTLWLAYARTHQPAYLSAARSWTRALRGQAAVRSTHDIGFQIMSSFGEGFRLTHRAGYERAIAQAATSLATRYSPVVRAVRSWGRRDDERHFKVIVDNLMNLQLLFWAGRHESRPAWTRMATRHALTTARHFVRADGSVIHLVDFDPRTGRVQGTGNPQGYSPTSTWSRGQAWAVAGFAAAYGWTGRAELLRAARRTAHFFVRHLPSDCVPYWDFDAPDIPDAPSDSSAAAIAAVGLLDLSGLDPSADRRRIWAHDAASVLWSLTESYVAPTGDALLTGATATYGVEPSGIGTSYGDYYMVKAVEHWLALHR